MSNISKSMMRGVAERDCARSELSFHALELVGNDIERLLPTDAFVSGLAAILRIPFTIRIEVNPFHRIEQSIFRVDHRFRTERVWGGRCLAGRCKSIAA